ncbi:hypothetical protein ABJY79_06005 [Vibrio parahaemolyticus]|uniref:hypothetical protein n=1 Tax=Vibrio parahaemolyticus TaxID=670 RepID=UPI001D7ADFC2|nr:hypothetical protein [Vibrio parahaemolyticus]EJG1745081.1 hypothetical protein [Vibrio parahaemolyticus]MCG7777281.1 hypothetical protein [Vibrio parahaemolyticus]HCH4207436.1 hypothetical protein [Vibrio parahaemolyticus]HCH6053333.1 hypothetical protein [Vibrio parahaemolyticus]HCM1468133.1 hypothetical protein [Vibrio parahaemolyticus]
MSYELKNTDMLVEILDRIKSEHETYPESGLMADDATNERIQVILRDFGIDDDSDEIEEKFGLHGLDLIRQAEQGSCEYEDLQQKPENKSNSKSRRRNRP